MRPRKGTAVDVLAALRPLLGYDLRHSQQVRGCGSAGAGWCLGFVCVLGSSSRGGGCWPKFSPP